MVCDLQLELHGGVETLARVIARLHAVHVELSELHVSGAHACLHLAAGARLARVRSVLDRLPDVSVL